MNIQSISNAMMACTVAVALLFGISTNASAASQTTWVFKGTVTEINEHRIELMGINDNGVEVRPKFRITPNTTIKDGVLLIDASDDVRMEVKNELRRGSVVTVWHTASHEAMVIQNMAPMGQGDFYGPVDCASCGD